MNKHFYKNLLPGTLLFNRFTLNRCLNASDVSGVFLCFDSLRQYEVVLKIVYLKTPNIEEDLKIRVRREIELCNKVMHENVINAVEVFEDSEQIAFSMEYLNSGTLSDVLERNGMPQMKIALDWLTQIARGLKAIHDAGVIHRDIKPENILFDRNGRIKISDFGISTDNETPDFPVDSLTGTINFLCPEYISKGVCDHRGDIYAWGVTAYLLLTGRLPFKGESLIETLSQRVTEDPLPPNKLNLNIPRPVSDLILKALQRNPEKRVKDLAVVLNILDEFAAGEEEIILENSIIAQTQMA